VNRNLRIGLIALAAFAILGVRVFSRPFGQRLILRACFDNVQGLRQSAQVRIAGVDVGRVTKVRARPDNKLCPADVEMQLATLYDLKVPTDAIALVEVRGLLGEQFVDIDVQDAKGPPATNHAILQTKAAISQLEG